MDHPNQEYASETRTKSRCSVNARPSALRIEDSSKISYPNDVPVYEAIRRCLDTYRLFVKSNSSVPIPPTALSGSGPVPRVTNHMAAKRRTSHRFLDLDNARRRNIARVQRSVKKILCAADRAFGTTLIN
jgi:hypothetical protein